jgi:hypothetical protein
MFVNKSQRYLIGLALAATFSANIQSANALTNMPADSIEDGTMLASMSEMISLVATPSPTVTPQSTTGLPMMMASEHKENVAGVNTSNALTELVSNQSTSQPASGSFVSTSYNTVSMLRKMEDQQNIGYLEMSDAEPISDALTQELKITTQIALLSDNLCADLGNRKLSLGCQDKNVEKAMAMPMPMPMLNEKYMSAQMTKNVSFLQNSDNGAATVSK